MIRWLLAGILLDLSAAAHAFEADFSFPDYEAAKRSSVHVRFDMEHSNLGLITSTLKL